MTAINAYKMDGLGNDFVIIDRRKNSINLTKEKIKLEATNLKMLKFPKCGQLPV